MEARTSMDQSSLIPPDPSPNSLHGERRRSVRQKLHTPVFASFNGGQTGPVVDLSELLDLDERGFAIQTNERLEVNRALSLCLDLTETNSYVHGSGQVVWSDDTGRAGIRFSYLPDPSRQVLKEWLFANLLIASANRAARAEQIAHHQQQETPAVQLPVADDQPPAASLSPAAPSLDRAAQLSALDDVRREVRALADADAVLDLIASRALTLTGASGAALALLTDDAMLCRARAGDLAPPLGSALDVKEGLSGECIRSGLAVSCEDTSTDPRVDPELCRRLGLGSFMAVPIFTDFRVVGLLEVFSPHRRTFTEAQSTVLDRLVELVPKTKANEIEAAIEQTDDEEPEIEEPEIEEIETRIGASEATGLHPSDEEPTDLHTVREALWEHAPEHQPPPLAHAPELEEQPSADRQDKGLEPAPSSSSGDWSRVASLVLLCIAIAVVALVLGYLMAPVIERRLAGREQSPRFSPETAMASSGSPAPSASVSRASWQGAASRSAQHRSLSDLRTFAEQGDAEAQWGLGILYHNGEGVPQDDAEAVRWFRRAADQAYVPALSALGSHYWSGRGVTQDYAQAYFWFQLALAEGDGKSKSLLEGLATQMTGSQIAEARQQAEAWLHSHNQPAKPASN